MFNYENVYLDKFKKEYIDVISSWFEDVEFLSTYDYVPPIPMTREEVENTLDEYEKNNESELFIVKTCEDDKVIGLIGFLDIIWENSAANLFVGIGDKSKWGLGYGKEAVSLILDYGFNELDFHRVGLNVIEGNTRAISLYESLGFKKEGIFREFLVRNDKRINLELYGMLKSEWNDKFK